MLLYHATFRANLRGKTGIIAGGLSGNIKKRTYSGEVNVRGIYFAYDPEVALSFAKSADNVSDNIYNSGIVLLVVDSRSLNYNLFLKDSNILNDENDTVLYGVDNIPSSVLGIYNFKEKKIYALNAVNRVTKDYLGD